MVLGSKQIKRMTCIACNDTIGDHSFNKLGKCLIRIQGSMILDHNKKGNAKTYEHSTKDEIDVLDKASGVTSGKDSSDDLLSQNNILNGTDDEVTLNGLNDLNRDEEIG